MARSTRKPQTYQTSAAILALSSNDQFDLVMGSAGTPTWAVVRTSAGLDYARVVSLWPDKVQAEAAGRALYAERGYLDPVIYIGLAQPWVTWAAASGWRIPRAKVWGGPPAASRGIGVLTRMPMGSTIHPRAVPLYRSSR
jgi:hypothetical protein